MVMGTPFESLEVNSDVPQYVFIGSLDITSNTELLHLLEARYRISFLNTTLLPEFNVAIPQNILIFPLILEESDLS